MDNKNLTIIKSNNAKVHTKLKSLVKTKRKTKNISICLDRDFNLIQTFLEDNCKTIKVCTARQIDKKFKTLDNENWVTPNVNNDEYLKYLRNRRRRIYGQK